MKKTITINLAGVVFHIEEDAYDILQKYLDSVKQYFSKVEGGAEIQRDIESRIAELFSMQINEFKQAISNEEVESVIKQLGSVEDMMDEEDVRTEIQSPDTENANAEYSSNPNDQKKLTRDSSNAILGGVLSGLSAYFGINPLWVRLSVLALFFGLFFLPNISGFLFLAYLVLWIAMPSETNLENRGKFKKFLRSRKNQMVAGVSGGLGAYFNIDPVIVRIIFVVTTLFAGSGLLAYIILWVITPEAKSLTDEIQMEGNPVTLNSIEDQIRRNVKMEDKNAQNNVVKVLTFPFKLIGIVVAALGPLVKFAFDALRVFVAIFLLVIGGIFLFVIVILSGGGLGFIDPTFYNIQTGDFPLARLAMEISPWMVMFVSIAAAIPAIVILLLSFSLMAKRNLLVPIVGLVLFGLFLCAIGGTAFTVIPLVQKFKSEGSYVESKDYNLKSKMVTLSLNPTFEENKNYHSITLEIRGWEDSTFKLTKRFKAHGKTRNDASANARLAQYNVMQQDSSLIFDSGLIIDPNIPYRAQRLEAKLFMPYGQRFRMDKELGSILTNPLSPNGYNTDFLEGNIWIFTRKGLKCLTCKETFEDKSEYEDEEL